MPACAIAQPDCQSTIRPQTYLPHILCIDDDPDIHTILEIRLREYQVKLSHAFHGMQGFAESLASPPDLIISDIAMPNGNGEYLIDLIRDHPQTSQTPVVVLSGTRDERLRARLRRRGADAILHKPLRFERLLEELRNFIDLWPTDDANQT